MSEKSYEQQFTERFGHPVKYAGSQPMYVCPECGHRSLTGNLAVGVFFCFHCRFGEGQKLTGVPSAFEQQDVDLELQAEIIRCLLPRLTLKDHDRIGLWARGIYNPERYGLVSTCFKPERFLTEYTHEQLEASGLFTVGEGGLQPCGALRYGHLIVPYWEGDQYTGFKSRQSALYEWDQSIKYKAPRGFLLRGRLWWFEEGYKEQDLILTEGELKAITLMEYGFRACSIPGIASYECAKTVGDWVRDGLVRRVFIILDSDPGYETDSDLHAAAKNCARYLPAGSWRILFLPQSTLGVKMGVDNFVQYYGEQELGWWLERAWIEGGRQAFCPKRLG
jgi:hypothetical protein